MHTMGVSDPVSVGYTSYGTMHAATTQAPQLASQNIRIHVFGLSPVYLAM